MNKENILTYIIAIISVYLTWELNHRFGANAILANGIVGFAAVLILPKYLAGPAYTSSFVGMSSKLVLPNILAVIISGIIVATIIIFTPKIYSGIGGKGGTTSAVSTIITKFIMGITG